MRIAIMGLARSGMAAAKLALKLGYEVSVSDACFDHGHAITPSPEMQKKAEELKAAGARVEIGGHTKEFLKGANLLILSPGVPDSAEPLVWAREAGIEAVGETEFAARHCKGRFVAVTGTNGKTTTTSLISHILDVANVPHITGGNIGIPLSENALSSTEDTVIVLEMSSFQLETIKELHPYVSVWLNLTPDHLDRYKNIEAYRAAKENVFRRQEKGAYAVVWHEEKSKEEKIIKDGGLNAIWVDETGNDATIPEDFRAVLKDNRFVISLDGKAYDCGSPEEMQLRGRHNAINLLCAMSVAKVLGVNPDVIKKACASFTGLSHRIEEVAKKDNVIFVDDSKGTNPEATMEAVRAFPYPQALILGGYDKGSDYSLLIPYMEGRVAKLILLGATNDKFYEIFKEKFSCLKVSSMEEAVRKGYESLPEGGTVLLSPACASFDMYKNFEERGDDFAARARAFSKQPTNPHKEEPI